MATHLGTGAVGRVATALTDRPAYLQYVEDSAMSGAKAATYPEWAKKQKVPIPPPPPK